jgi:hypothetical protein
MRLSRQLGLLVFLVAGTGALVLVRTGSVRRVSPSMKPNSANKPIPDLGVTVPLNQPGGSVAPAQAYEVYSALYQDQAAVDEPLAFAEDSWTDVPQVGESCLRPATLKERKMADAFVAANRQSHRWERKFSIAQGYRLLSNSEASQVRKCLSPAGHDSVQCANYKQIKHVRLLGVPGFDPAYTRALVSVIKSCGDVCGSGGIFEVVKVGGIWRRPAVATEFTRNCSWTY